MIGAYVCNIKVSSDNGRNQPLKAFVDVGARTSAGVGGDWKTGQGKKSDAMTGSGRNRSNETTGQSIVKVLSCPASEIIVKPT